MNILNNGANIKTVASLLGHSGLKHTESRQNQADNDCDNDREQDLLQFGNRAKLIDFYEDYFQVKYPIPLSYHLALPDFSAGAMENWGLVTYREVYLLVDENSSAASRQQVALVVAHELAHQWFGNLVTMKWWEIGRASCRERVSSPV